MTRATKRYATVGAVLMIMCLQMLALIILDRAPESRAAARVWAGQLSAERLTNLQSEFDALPRERQLAVFARLDNQQKATFWSQRLEAFRRSHSLSAEQLGVLDDAEALLTPTFFAQYEDARGRSDALLTRLRRHFDRDDQVTLGAAAPPPPTILAVLSWPAKNLRGWLTLHAKDPACNCIVENNNNGCDSDQYCEGQDMCEPDPEGCYCGWFVWCDCYGLCHFKPL